MSDLKSQCLRCGGRIVVDGSRAGSVFACPRCGASASVPLPAGTGELLSVDIRFRCTACRKKLSIDAEHTGITIVCPNCNHQVTVPNLPDYEHALDASPLVAPPAQAASVLSQDEVAFLMQR